MRLFRLTTDQLNPDSNATQLCEFDATYNSNIILKPNSKIALQSASINTLPTELIISSTNNDITYQIDSNYEATVRLTHRQYGSSQINELLTDITNKLNDSVVYIDTSPLTNKVLGLEWRCHIVDDHTVIQYRIGKAGNYFSVDTNWNFKNTQAIASGTNYKLGTIGADPANSALTNCCGMPFAMSKGNGFLRARSLIVEYNAPGVGNGYIMGLVSNFDKIESNTLDITDVKYGIRVTRDAPGDPPRYSTIVDGLSDGTFINMDAYTPNSSDNEFIELSINGDSIDYNVYRDDGNVNGFRESLRDPVAYDNGNYYPVFIFNGERAKAQADAIKYTPEPYGNQPNIEPAYGLLGNSTPPIQPRRDMSADQNWIFMSESLQKHLGYANQRVPVTGNILGNAPLFRATNGYFVPEEADAMLVQLMNLQIESYDSYSNTLVSAGGQRKNILSVIPTSSSTGKIIYEPSYPTFLDLYNDQPIFLRNLNIRVVREDYSSIVINGMGTLVILISE
tara:strand:+ start:1418 stop:2941 length:1524 start_codon:yes stop_codon:yes gene_type:complete